MNTKLKFLITLAGIALSQPAFAQASLTSARTSVESYYAVIGHEDLYNSRGDRLTHPWQVIRQDRANLYAGRAVTPGDDRDTYFSLKSNREQMERMIQRGRIEGHAARQVMRAGTLIKVTVISAGGEDFLDVKVIE